MSDLRFVNEVSTSKILTVKGRPLASLLVASCSSNMSYKTEILLSSSAIYRKLDELVTFPNMLESSYNGELNIGRTELAAKRVDVLHPLVVLLETVRGDTDHLDIALRKVGGATSDLTELGGADRGEVSGVGEEDGLATIRLD